MSSFAFSHQFSQRWLATHPPVKYAIIQELDDIATLLQPETELHDYEFTVPNLHEHVENLLTEEQKRKQKERIEAERIEQLRQEAIRREEIKREQERQEKIRQEKEALEQQRLEREREAQAERERLEQQRLAQIAQQQAQEERLERQRQEALLQQQAEQERLAQLEIHRDQLRQAITAELGEHMENYIQLALQDTLEKESQKLRDELKPWLEQEVNKQLAERWQPFTDLAGVQKLIPQTAEVETVPSAPTIAEAPMSQDSNLEMDKAESSTAVLSKTETPQSDTAEAEISKPESLITPTPEKPALSNRSGKKNRR